MLALLLVSASAASSAAQPGWREFEHPQIGFVIATPAGWEKLVGDENMAFVAVGPRAAGTEYRMSVVVVTARVPANESLPRADATLSRMLRNFREVQVLRTDRVDFRGTPALIKYLTRRADTGVEVYQMMLVLIRDRRAYAVIGTTAARSVRVDAENKLLQNILLGFRP
jgi:hypothetical protein